MLFTYDASAKTAEDTNLLKWRQETAETGFEKTPAGNMQIKVPGFSMVWFNGAEAGWFCFYMFLLSVVYVFLFHRSVLFCNPFWIFSQPLFGYIRSFFPTPFGLQTTN